MPRQYVKVEHLAKEVFELKSQGYTNRQVAERYGLTLDQIRQLVARQNRKAKLQEMGYILRSKGRPKKTLQTTEELKNNEIIRLRMHVEILRNFLLEVGRM